MKKSYWIVAIVIFAIVIGIGIGIYLSSNDEPQDVGQKPKMSKLDHINTKIRAIEGRVRKEIEMLKLTSEMENALARKVDRVCILFGTIFWLIMISIAASFYLNGFDLLTSILNTAGLASLACPLLSIIFWRTIDFNTIVAKTRVLVKSWLDKKYGHNPDAISELNNSIGRNTEELNELVSST